MAGLNSNPLPRRGFGRAHLEQVLTYDPMTGLLRWRIRTHGHGGAINPGDVAGSDKDGYIQIIVGKKPYRAHHLAWLLMTGEWPPAGQDVDHADRNRSNNAWSNLRLASRAQNNVNTSGRRNNTSGCPGVSFRKDTQKWHARITYEGKVILLGNYEKKEDAIAARRAVESVAYGKFVPAQHP